MAAGLVSQSKKWWIGLAVVAVALLWLCWPSSQSSDVSQDPTMTLLPGKLGEFYRYFEREFVGATGLSPWLAKAVALLLVIPLVFAIPRMTSIWSENRQKGTAIGLAVIAAFSLLMFGLTQQRHFDLKTGQARQWYAETPEGRRYFDQPGFDPKYGLELRAVTPNIVQADYRQQQGLTPQRLQLVSLVETDLFDRVTGESRVWYHRAEDGRLELFNRDGRHPQDGQPLAPLTREVADDYERQQAAQQRLTAEKQQLAAEKQRRADRQRYFATDTNRERPTVAILAVNDVGGWDEDAADFIARTLVIRAGTVSTDVFTRAFVTNGLFQRLGDGDAQVLIDLEAHQACDFVLLVHSTTTSERHDLDDPDLRTVRLTFNLQLWDCHQAARRQRERLSVKAAGFSIEAARTAALQRVAPALAEIQWSFQEKTQ